MYGWDEAKRQHNLAKHGTDFADMERFDWSDGVIINDMRHDYGEVRHSVTRTIDARLHVCVFTSRKGRVRIISLRKANKRDSAKWHASIK